MPPPAMHSSLRLTAVFMLGVLLGAVVALVGAVLAVRYGAADPLLRSYFASEQRWPDVNAQLAQQGFTQDEQQQAQAVLSTTTLAFGVPPGYATQAYADAFGGVINDLKDLASTTLMLNPVLVKMNSQSLSGNFNGFFDLVVEAKTLLAQQKAITARLGQDISALSAANMQTTDAQTKQLTSVIITASGPLISDLASYNSELDQLLSGAVPSAALVTSVAQTGGRLADDAKALGTAMAPLTERFKAAIPAPAAR